MLQSSQFKKNSTLFCSKCIFVVSKKAKNVIFGENFSYSARRLIGSRIIESAADCDQKLLAPTVMNFAQKKKKKKKEIHKDV
jgi:hypothetical protein